MHRLTTLSPCIWWFPPDEPQTPDPVTRSKIMFLPDDPAAAAAILAKQIDPKVRGAIQTAVELRAGR
jgi:hypothetical protein